MSASTRYMHPRARAAWKQACDDAGIRPIITQTYGQAPDSKGVHAPDGTYKDSNGKEIFYTAALDLSVKQAATRLRDGGKLTMGEKQIKWFLYCLAKNGFVAWYRYQGAFAVKHIHAIYVGVPMKDALRSQVRDFLNDRTGLKGHARETFWTADSELDSELRRLFEANN